MLRVWLYGGEKITQITLFSVQQKHMKKRGRGVNGGSVGGGGACSRSSRGNLDMRSCTDKRNHKRTLPDRQTYGKTAEPDCILPPSPI